jgi:Bacterial transcriptional activator domain
MWFMTECKSGSSARCSFWSILATSRPTGSDYETFLWCSCNAVVGRSGRGGTRSGLARRCCRAQRFGRAHGGRPAPAAARTGRDHLGRRRLSRRSRRFTEEDTFTDLVARARRCLANGEHPAAVLYYRAALDTWRGPEAFADASADLVEADRSRVSELRTAAAEVLAAALLEQPNVGGPAEARALAAGLIETHPLRERPYQLGMLAAYQCDRQAEALEIYRDLRRRLQIGVGCALAELGHPAAARTWPPRWS